MSSDDKKKEPTQKSKLRRCGETGDRLNILEVAEKEDIENVNSRETLPSDKNDLI